MYKTVFSMLFLMFAFVGKSCADEAYSSHIMSIGSNVLSYRFMFGESVGVSYGYYQSSRKRSNNLGQSYTRDYSKSKIGIRLNFNPENVLRSFTEFSLSRINVDYEGATAENYDVEERLISFGVEYLLGSHFSVEGALGFQNYNTTLETEKESGTLGPITLIAVSYLF